MAGLGATEYIPDYEGDNHCHEVNCKGKINKQQAINAELKIFLYQCAKCKKLYYIREGK